jgi:uncharacterized membrane protein
MQAFSLFRQTLIIAMPNLDTLHAINIFCHVSSGTLALLLGIFALLSTKGGQFHRACGRWFLGFISVVILTGLLGVFVFDRNKFLLVITLLSAYQAYSGYRTLQTKNNQVNFLDIGVGLVTVASAFYFLYYFQKIGMIWSPVIIYSTLGALFLVVFYDWLRYFISPGFYQKLWLPEHIYKMIGAFSALLSAFAGTVFEDYQPYSQILPSVFGVLLQVYFTIRVCRTNQKQYQL